MPQEPVRAGFGDVCRVSGCGKRRLGSSELCAEHLNERLRLERASRERSREHTGNWAAWSTPEPTMNELAGQPPTEEERARTRSREELEAVRAETGKRLEAEAARIPWPPLLKGLGPLELLKRFERSLAALSPERELEAWRAIRVVVDAPARGEIGRDALASLDAAVREPAQLLLGALRGGAAAHPAPSPTLAGDVLPPRPEPREGEGMEPVPGTPAGPPPGASPVEGGRRRGMPEVRAPASGARRVRDDGLAGAPPPASLFAEVGDALGRAVREALDLGGERLKEAARPGGLLDPARLGSLAAEAAALVAAGVRDAARPTLIRWLTGGRLDARELRKRADGLVDLARKTAALVKRRSANAEAGEVFEVLRPCLRFLYRHWFHVEATGLEHVPDRGRTIVAARRAGALPWGAAMLAVALLEEHAGARRLTLFLPDGRLMGLPFVAELFALAGMLVGSVEEAERLLEQDGLVALFVPGDASETEPRGELAALARRSRTPIVPCAFEHGAAGPAMPWLESLAGAVGLDAAVFPLPARLRIEFRAPVAVGEGSGGR